MMIVSQGTRSYKLKKNFLKILYKKTLFFRKSFYNYKLYRKKYCFFYLNSQKAILYFQFFFSSINQIKVFVFFLILNFHLFQMSSGFSDFIIIFLFIF